MAKKGGGGLLVGLLVAGAAALYFVGGGIGGATTSGHGVPDPKQLPGAAVDGAGKAIPPVANGGADAIEHASKLPGFGTFLAMVLIAALAFWIWRSMSKGLAVALTILGAFIFVGMMK